MEEPKQQMDDQALMCETAVKVRDRVREEIPYLENVIEICKKEHPAAITPLTGIIRSFARFTDSEDNIKLLDLVRELFASYAFSKKNKDSLERRNSKKIMETLNAHHTKIEEYNKKGQMVDYHMDFYPYIRQYMFLLIRGHRQSEDEERICGEILALLQSVAERKLNECYTAIESCDKLLN